MYRFGMPNSIITDNGTQFIAREFKDFVQTQASRLTMPHYHTHRVMVKLSVDISYAAPQAHRIINEALHREYSPAIVFIFS
jgi:hypothetical protein